ncbi:unnamed protein product, partial [Pylaiella littoralis]
PLLAPLWSYRWTSHHFPSHCKVFPSHSQASPSSRTLHRTHHPFASPPTHRRGPTSTGLDRFTLSSAGLTRVRLGVTAGARCCRSCASLPLHRTWTPPLFREVHFSRPRDFKIWNTDVSGGHETIVRASKVPPPTCVFATKGRELSLIIKQASVIPHPSRSPHQAFRERTLVGRCFHGCRTQRALP